MQHIAVIGAGSWGTALASLLARQSGLGVTVWARDADQLASMAATGENLRYLPGFELPASIQYEADLESAVKNCDVVLMAVPSHVFMTVMDALDPHLFDTRFLIWATKGLDPVTNDFFSAALSKRLPKPRGLGVLSGPSFAVEVMRGLPCAVTFASEQPELRQAVQTTLTNQSFRVYVNEDVIGVQLGGAIKNIFAIATGISDGCEFGANARAALITRGLAEMTRLGAVLGAQQSTMMGLSGVGDLILTATDNQSRNRRFGLALARGKSHEEAHAEIRQIVEGIYSVSQIYRRAESVEVKVPITEVVYRIIHEDLPPREAMTTLMSRKPGPEFSGLQ